jgi:hypothetical protein
MKIHVLAGDALAEQFRQTNIGGEIIICRECLIEGDLKAKNRQDFWNVRANFIKSAYDEPEEKYFQNVVAEFQKLDDLSPETEVNLWFEYELFCQANLWFCLFLLSSTNASVYRVAPIVRDENEIWKGFGDLNAEDLEKCFAAREKFEKDDVLLGANLWEAYQNADYDRLERLSETKSKCFPYLKEVCRAESEKNTRPKEILMEINKESIKDFPEIFSEFSRRAGVYGFGDAQVKRILQEI